MDAFSFGAVIAAVIAWVSAIYFAVCLNGETKKKQELADSFASANRHLGRVQAQYFAAKRALHYEQAKSRKYEAQMAAHGILAMTFDFDADAHLNDTYLPVSDNNSIPAGA